MRLFGVLLYGRHYVIESAQIRRYLLKRRKSYQLAEFGLLIASICTSIRLCQFSRDLSNQLNG